MVDAADPADIAAAEDGRAPYGCESDSIRLNPTVEEIYFQNGRHGCLANADEGGCIHEPFDYFFRRL
jgi:hypothetical protein